MRITTKGPMLLGCPDNANEVYQKLLSLGFVDVETAPKETPPERLIKRRVNAKGKLKGVYGSGLAGEAWMEQPGRFAHITRRVVQ